MGSAVVEECSRQSGDASGRRIYRIAGRLAAPPSGAFLHALAIGRGGYAIRVVRFVPLALGASQNDNRRPAGTVRGGVLTIRLEARMGEWHPDPETDMIARLARDSSAVTWRAIAKDGRDLPPDQATTRPAVQQSGNGETYDFEFTPNAPGDLRVTMSSGAGVLLVSQVIHVR